MRKIKASLCVLASMLTLGALVACEGSDPVDTTTGSPSETTTEVTTTIETSTETPISETTTETTTEQTSATFEVKDYVELTKLDQEVTASSNFFGEEGIGFATLVRNVDGDTAVVRTNGQEITLRFLGVDTPESTGQVEEWGKTASKFTANILDNAEKIVLQSDGGAATYDTTGSRYLTYVWYKFTGGDYRLLNLELVQEGLSYGKSATAKRYSDVLVLAQNQAMHLGKKLFGDEKDPNYFYGDAVECDIKYVIDNQEELLPKAARVKFDCTITREDGYYVYAQDYDAETNKYYSILLYKGYNLNTAKLKPGYRVIVTGNVGKYNDMIQISGMQDIKGSKSLDNLKVLDLTYPIDIKTITPTDLDSKDPVLERRIVKMENVKVSNTYTTAQGDSAGAITINGYVSGYSGTVTLRTSVLYNDKYEITKEDVFKDKTMDVIGVIDTYNNKYQIHIVSMDDVTFKN